MLICVLDVLYLERCQCLCKTTVKPTGAVSRCHLPMFFNIKEPQRSIRVVVINMTLLVLALPPFFYAQTTTLQPTRTSKKSQKSERCGFLLHLRTHFICTTGHISFAPPHDQCPDSDFDTCLAKCDAPVPNPEDPRINECVNDCTFLCTRGDWYN
jgi:hypothetical protein